MVSWFSDERFKVRTVTMKTSLPGASSVQMIRDKTPVVKMEVELRLAFAV